MIPVRIETLVMGMIPSPSVIVLRPLADPKDPDTPVSVLPIWIGATEAAAIATPLEGISAPRPMTHDLCSSIIDALGGEISFVEICDVIHTTFFARIHMTREDRRFVVDSRPSDAIALALRAGVRIYVDEGVFASASFPYLLAGDIDPAQEIEDFHSFIENVNPEDFLYGVDGSKFPEGEEPER